MRQLFSLMALVAVGGLLGCTQPKVNPTKVTPKPSDALVEPTRTVETLPATKPAPTSPQTVPAATKPVEKTPEKAGDKVPPAPPK